MEVIDCEFDANDPQRQQRTEDRGRQSCQDGEGMPIALVQHAKSPDVDGKDGSSEQQKLLQVRFHRLLCFATEVGVDVVG